MPISARRNPLLPWFIGIVIIAIVDIYVGYWFYSSNCQAPGLAQLLVLVAVPGVYLVLMYLTFKSQA
jgi:RsiW-degrading membrane proteinase PrsW (M82 family)